MNRKNLHLVGVMVAFTSLALLAGCEAEHNPLPEMTMGHGTMPTHTGQYNVVRAVVQVGYMAGNAASTLAIFAAILLVPWFIIVIIPGFLAKNLEMKIESGLMFLFTAAMWVPATEVKALWLLIICVAIPAFIQFWWKSEDGKITLFGAPALLGTLVLMWLGFQWLRRGMILHPVIALVVTICVIWCMIAGGKKGDAAHKAEAHGGHH